MAGLKETAIAYAVSDEKIKFKLAAWDCDAHDAVVTDVTCGEETTVRIPWGGGGHTDVLKLAAYVTDCQAATLFVNLGELLRTEGGGEPPKPLLLRHAFSKKCVIELHVSACTGVEDALKQDLEKSFLHELDFLNNCTLNICSHIHNTVANCYASVGPTLLPEATAAREFTSLMTQLPVSTSTGSSLCINMAHLRHAIAGRGSAVSLPALMYFVHAACLTEGIGCAENLEAGVPHLQFRVYVRAITMFTADGSFDRYTGDCALTGVKKAHTIWGDKTVVFEKEESENIQAPFSQTNMRGEDCEDWAMAQVIIADAFKYHASTRVAEIVRIQGSEQIAALNAIEVPIKNINAIEKLALLHRIMLFAMPQFNTHLCTVSAASKSMVQGGTVAWNRPGGHECCVAVYCPTANSLDRTQYAALLEPTNWVDNTTVYSEAECKAAMHVAAMDAGAKGAQGVRMHMLQHVGALRGGGHSESFYKCVFAVDDYLTLGVDEQTRQPVTWGAHPDDLLDKLEARRQCVFMMKIGAPELPPDDFKKYMLLLEHISREAQPPPLRAGMWTERLLKECGELPVHVPPAFRNIYHKRPSALVAYYSSTNAVDGSFPFMRVHISAVVQERSRM